MSSTSCMDQFAGEILKELRANPQDSRVGEAVLNAVVDAMVQANIDLNTVSLRDVKNLVSHVYRRGRYADGLPLAAF